MRTGIVTNLSSSDHNRLTEIAADRNSPQKGTVNLAAGRLARCG